MVKMSDHSDPLQEVLERLDACSSRLLSGLERERDALETYDMGALAQAVVLREACMDELMELEQLCRQVIGESSTLRHRIDMVGTEKASFLQDLREQVLERIRKVQQINRHNQIRLRAAYDVVSEVVEAMGLRSAQNTYGPDGGR